MQTSPTRAIMNIDIFDRANGTIDTDLLEQYRPLSSDNEFSALINFPRGSAIAIECNLRLETAEFSPSDRGDPVMRCLKVHYGTRGISSRT